MGGVYFEQYKVRLDIGTVISELEAALILDKTEVGFRFKYKYCYYFFVAKYFQENLETAAEEPALRKQLRDMAIEFRIIY